MVLRVLWCVAGLETSPFWPLVGLGFCTYLGRVYVHCYHLLWRVLFRLRDQFIRLLCVSMKVRVSASFISSHYDLPN